MTTVRVVPDVTGLDKEFDYTVPDGFDPVALGDLVRVPLHRRRITGWVVAVDPPDQVVGLDRLQPLDAVVSKGPSAELIELARWASIRWAAGRLRPFLVTASPPRRIKAIPKLRRTPTVVSAGEQADRALAIGHGMPGAANGLIVVPPAMSPVEAIAAAATLGPTLVVVPAPSRAAAMAAALRRRGITVAVVPAEWARAAGGADVVIGGRAAAWAPCPGLAAAVVIDEHDEALQEQRAPTWHARDVMIERARRSGAAAILTSPCPTAVGAHEVGGRIERLGTALDRAGWPLVDVVDRTDEEPWKTSLVTSALIAELRNHDRTVVCVHNTPGRGRILSCRRCMALQRCERCDAAVALTDEDRFVCPRCDTGRAKVCQACGAAAFANLRPGITRLREELEAAAGRPVVAVSARSQLVPAPSAVYVGTEAVLHRVARADVVAYLDIDRELLAPRYRAGEQALALLARGARLVGPRDRGGRLVVQTFLPDHEVIRAALHADPARLLVDEAVRRQQLQLPPAAALAAVSGKGARELTDALGEQQAGQFAVGASGDGYLVRGEDWLSLGAALIDARRTSRSHARVAVDPPRL